MNHKYNVVSFIPVILFNQFRMFGNLFYLIMTITQFIDVLKVGFLFSYLSPLLIVIGVSMLKELYDDINRRIQDKKTNAEEYIVHTKGNKDSFARIIPSKDIKIGDVIELKQNQRVPADIIVLKTFNEAGDNHSYIRTDQLDGETDWKLRKTPGLTQEMSTNDILHLNGIIEYEPPSKFIYSFQGVLKFIDSNGQLQQEALACENTMWSSTVLASERVIGIVIYTGNETRARMNSSNPKVKFGILDLEINTFNIYLFFIMMALAIILTLRQKSEFLYRLFALTRFIVLFCGIIPISLRVNLDISKSFFSFFGINIDTSIKDTIARNSTIPEELGRISYVFSDKTGTLTKNEMVFKKIAMENDTFTEESFNDLTLLLKDECNSADAPLMDLIQKNEEEIDLTQKRGSVNTSIISERSMRSMTVLTRRKKRNRGKLVRDTITAMVLCNNVTPIKDSTTNKISYQASSPDELALVKFAETLNMKLIHRTDKEIFLENSNGYKEEYDVLANFPFSSDTKRMGIVLRNRNYGHIIFYMKGAETVIEKFTKPEYKMYIKENSENLAQIGLRTLVLTQKIIPKNEFDEWNKEYNDALCSMENRKEKIRDAVSKLEKDMDFLCVTGVEDLLQDDVNNTLENIRNAGIKTWMLTGDKVETATCIAISTGLKAKDHKIYTIRYDEFGHKSINDDVNELNEKLTKVRDFDKIPHILIIDGDCLDLALRNSEELFFKSAMNAPAVVCCRCSPTQKRIIVKTIKKYTDKRTCAVGDGGNDVAMIQEADVGIGIVGKEGLQASLSSDFSILEFRYLNTLLLWWGRIAYKNTSSMANFVMHRGLIISLIQFLFSLMFYDNSVALYNGMLIFGYSTIFTSFPSVTMLLDRDTEKDNVIKFPILYKKLLKGRELSIKAFLYWTLKSIFQAYIIMFGAMFLFKDNIFLVIVTVTFTSLIFTEILNVYTEINKFHKFMFVSLGGTAITYLLCLLLLPNVFDVSFIFTGTTLLYISILTVIGWAPFFLANRLKTLLFPENYEILNATGSK
ncbi:MAG: phospholipid-translocating P-type ATPase [archaeon]|nr:phospholipid-translocating P-type ATPase [archaeon]